jgi:hypothetical protein
MGNFCSSVYLFYYATPTLGLLGFTARPWAMIAAIGPQHFALQPSGCHHGPWAGRKTQDPSGGAGVMYHNYTAVQNLLHKRRACGQQAAGKVENKEKLFTTGGGIEQLSCHQISQSVHLTVTNIFIQISVIIFVFQIPHTDSDRFLTE